VCSRPFGLAFDGVRIWVTCALDGKLFAAALNTLGNVTAGDTGVTGLSSPRNLAFDGANIWSRTTVETP
jgi:hypothetical protein